MSDQQATEDQLSQAFESLRLLKAKVRSLSARQHAPIAITGMAMRLPSSSDGVDVRTLGQLDAALRAEKDAICAVPGLRWPRDLYDPDPEATGRTHFREGGFITEPAAFDASFFGIAPREAKRLDPQQRLMLAVVWEAIEDAGLTSRDLAGTRTGVFVGANSSDYFQLQLEDPAFIDTYSLVGGTLSIIANRVSYQWDLRGPSMTVDTACSSSLVATHTALRALRSGECDLAIVAGVNLILSPAVNVAHSKGLPLAPGGRCRTFDASAEGYTRGEGLVAMVLRTEDSAIAARDRTHGLLLGSAVNQDGKSNGLTAPNTSAQVDCIRAALADARVDPSEVELIEAHGTGTELGDPIEVEALADTYGAVAGQDLLVGSLKSNIGHLEAASGVAGIAKSVAAVKNRYRYSTLNVSTVSPLLPLDGTRIKVAVPGLTGPWTPLADRRVAGVSAFGAGGTNAHVIVASAAPPSEDAPVTDSPEHLMVSAATRTALRELAGRYADVVGARPAELGAIAAAAFHRRDWHPYRLAVPALDAHAVVSALREFADGVEHSVVRTSRATPARGVVLVIPGQGPHWRGMGADLYRDNAAFAAAVDEAEELLFAQLGTSIREVLCVAGEDEFPIELVQPSLFAMSLGLAAAWKAAGLAVEAVVGHSMGEVAAAYLVGALDLSDAVRVICARSRILGQIAGEGRMLLVRSDSATVADLVARAPGVSVGVVNGPSTTVLSGDPVQLEMIAAEVSAHGTYTKFVDVDVASHSPQVAGLREPLLEAISGVSTRPPQIPWFSTVLSTTVRSSLDETYWFDNMRDTVQFGRVVEDVIGQGLSVFVELSPHPTLVASVEEIAADRDVAVTGSQERGVDGAEAFAASVGSLWTQCHDGGPVAPTRSRVAMVDLPSYAFDDEVLWFSDTRGLMPWAGASGAVAKALQAPAPEHVPDPAGGDVRTVVELVVSQTLDLAVGQLVSDLGFFAQGMDSMMARRAATVLSDRLGRDLSTRTLFDHPSVDALVAFLDGAGATAIGRRAPADPRPNDVAGSEDELIRAIEAELAR